MFWNARRVRWFGRGLLLIQLVVAVVATRYVMMAKRVEADDLRQRGGLSGLTYFAAPLRLSLGMTYERERLLDWLRQVGFIACEVPEPGTFQQSSARVQVRARMPEFQKLQPLINITFRGGSIQRLDDGVRELTEAFIEAPLLQSWVFQNDDEVGLPMVVRRSLLERAAWDEGDLRRLLIASEDRRRQWHNGVDFIGLLDAVGKMALTAGRELRGAAGLEGQLAREAFLLNHEKTLWRKFDEICMAPALRRRYGSETVEWLYGNNVFLGKVAGYGVCYGFAAAAEGWFGQGDVNRLTLAQKATLVAALPSPQEMIKALRKGDAAYVTSRRNARLDALLAEHPELYSTEQIEQAKAEPCAVVFTTNRSLSAEEQAVRSYLNFAARSLPSAVREQFAQSGAANGMHLYLSVNLNLQQAIQRNVDEFARAHETALTGLAQGTKDSSRLQAAVVVMSRTGEVIALVGGRSDGQPCSGRDNRICNRATDVLSPPHSTFKPFYFAAALEQTPGAFTAASVFRGASGMLTTRQGMAVSDERLAQVMVGEILGERKAMQLVEKLIGHKLDAHAVHLSTGARGGFELTLLQLAQLFTALPGGVMVEPQPLAQVFKNGHAITLPPPVRQSLFTSGAAFITADVLRTTVTAGTARRAFSHYRLTELPALGAKTGSGKNVLWTVAVTPHAVVACWAGRADNSDFVQAERTLAQDHVAYLAAAAVTELKRYRPDLLAGKFAQPERVISLTMETQRQCVASQGSREYFLRAAAPARCAAKP